MEKINVKVIITSETQETFVRELFVDNELDLLLKVSQLVTLYNIGLNFKLEVKTL